MSANDIKRRKFVRGLLAVPAVPALVEAAQAPPPATTPQQQPQPQPNTPARQVPRQPQQVPQLELTPADLTAEPAPHFFTTLQFATLEKLGATLMPPLKSNPGALDAKAPEFLDFLISVSPAARQKSYQFGLDRLEVQAKEKYRKSFCDLDSSEVDAILRPLLVARPWPADLPADPLKGFIAEVHEDLRTATMNSREWATASEKAGRRFTRGFRGTGYYWFPIDPLS
jgi:gluconate 2-dehydrogenase subunit 3-like protein